MLNYALSEFNNVYLKYISINSKLAAALGILRAMLWRAIIAHLNMTNYTCIIISNGVK